MIRRVTTPNASWAACAAALLLLAACASEPIHRDEVDYPEHLKIPPDLVGPVERPPRRAPPGDGVEEEGEAAPLDADPTETVPTRVVHDGEEWVLDLPWPPEGAWGRVGEAMERHDFTILDRQRDDLYYVLRYEPYADGEVRQPGFFRRLFTRARRIDTSPRPFHVHLEAHAEGTRLSVTEADGEPAPDRVTQRLLTLLDRHLYY